MQKYIFMLILANFYEYFLQDKIKNALQKHYSCRALVGCDGAVAVAAMTVGAYMPMSKPRRMPS